MPAKIWVPGAVLFLACMFAWKLHQESTAALLMLHMLLLEFLLPVRELIAVSWCLYRFLGMSSRQPELIGVDGILDSARFCLGLYPDLKAAGLAQDRFRVFTVSHPDISLSYTSV